MESNLTPANSDPLAAGGISPAAGLGPPEDSAANDAASPPASGPACPNPTHHQGTRLEAKALWLLGSALAAAAVGCVAGLLQVQRIAPVGLLPVGVGLAVGLTTERLGHALGLRIGRWWIAAAIAWALLAIVAEVYIGHRDHVRDLKEFEASNPKAALFADADEQGGAGAAGLLHYFQGRFNQTPILISADAMLTIVAAAAWMEYRRRLFRRGFDPAAIP